MNPKIPKSIQDILNRYKRDKGIPIVDTKKKPTVSPHVPVDRGKIASKKILKEITKIIRSKERVKKTGEVFTPIKLVDEVLSKIPEEVWRDPAKTFIDPACGDGNFLVRVIAFKIQYGSTIQQALETTYGVDIMEDNIKACRERLLTLADDYDKDCFGYMETERKYGHIVNKNIVCANALTYDFKFKEQKEEVT